MYRRKKPGPMTDPLGIPESTGRKFGLSIPYHEKAVKPCIKTNSDSTTTQFMNMKGTAHLVESFFKVKEPLMCKVKYSRCVCIISFKT